MLLDTYKNFTVSPVVRTSVGVVRDRMGVPPTLDRVAGRRTLITKAVDEITSRIQISGCTKWKSLCVGHTVGRLSAIGRRRIHDDIGEERSGNGHSSLV
jgi:hypothetical protein